MAKCFGCFSFLLILTIIISILIAVMIQWSSYSVNYDELKQTQYWSDQPESSKSSSNIKVFKIEKSSEFIKDLNSRLSNTRFFKSLPGVNFKYGFKSEYLRKIVKYWQYDYNWDEQKIQLNSLPQFKTQIEGLDIHFIHVKPHDESKRSPLMLIHGWPGSVYEFHKVIPLLVKHNFEVICPSIPGYGFSDAPKREGFDFVDAARVFFKLMKRLGHNKFWLQGGDWGSLIASSMAKIYPNNVIGLHTNMIMANSRNPKFVIYGIMGYFFPSWMFDYENDWNKLFPIGVKWRQSLQETGYLHLQATKPDTVAVAISDSPAGMAAYILEKFSTWTDPENINRSDGGLEKYFSLDDLINNVMIYWLSENFVSSVRFYKEVFQSKHFPALFHIPTPEKVPVGLACYPYEIMCWPKVLASMAYKTIVHYSSFENGGHFPAFQMPKVFVEDFIKFTKLAEKWNREQS